MGEGWGFFSMNLVSKRLSLLCEICDSFLMKAWLCLAPSLGRGLGSDFEWAEVTFCISLTYYTLLDPGPFVIWGLILKPLLRENSLWLQSWAQSLWINHLRFWCHTDHRTKLPSQCGFKIVLPSFASLIPAPACCVFRNSLYHLTAWLFQIQ